jgi:hypothetical protein
MSSLHAITGRPDLSGTASTDTTRRQSGGASATTTRWFLSVEEFRPSLSQVVILVHQRIPDRNLGITVPVGAARSNIALFDDDGTKWVRQVLRRRLTFVPVIPLCGFKIFLRIFGDGVIVALTRYKRGRPAVKPPVDILVSLIECP